MAYRVLQQQVRDYDAKLGWVDESPQVALHMSEEVGEIARLMLRLEGYKKEEFSGPELGQEICDLLYLTLKLANNHDIDVDDAWERMWTRYESQKSRWQ